MNTVWSPNGPRLLGVPLCDDHRGISVNFGCRRGSCRKALVCTSTETTFGKVLGNVNLRRHQVERTVSTSTSTRTWMPSFDAISTRASSENFEIFPR